MPIKGFKMNLKASLESTKSNSPYLDIKEDSTVRVRFLPTNNPSGALFTRSVNHFKMHNPDDPNRTLVLACNEHFKGERCYLCELSAYLRNGDKAERAIAADIRPSSRFYAQVLPCERNEETDELEYTKPKLLGLPKTGVDDINALLMQQHANNEPYFCDEAEGQDVMVTRTGRGFDTRYKGSLTGNKVDLSETFEDWELEYMEDMIPVLGLKFASWDEQKLHAQRTFGDQLDWDELAEHGL
jgi:hypothetical protein